MSTLSQLEFKTHRPDRENISDLLDGAASSSTIDLEGITTKDVIKKVIAFPGAGTAVTDVSAVEAVIVEDGKIKTTTSTSGSKLLVFWTTGE